MLRTTFAATTAALLLLTACGESSAPPEEAGHGEAPAADFERGPHNGRLLRDGDFAIEVTVFEDGVPPEFHLYATRDGKPVDLATVQATLTVRRLDGEVNRFTFRPEEDYLRASGTVTEPHSFDVEVTAAEGGRTHRWTFQSYEGRARIKDAAARAAGMTLERAGPAEIGTTVELLGRVALDPAASAEVGAKYPGRVVSVPRNVGDRVGRGALLARVESSESLQTYSITAPIAGVITERRTNVGAVTGGEPLFVIADPSRTIAEFPVFPRDMERVRPGQQVQIGGIEGARRQAATIRDFLPTADIASQTLTARAALPNRDGFWRPGMNLKGLVTIDKRTAPIAVRTRALQAFRDFTVVFAKIGQTYEVRMLELGQQGPEWTEVLGGLKPGTQYVVDGSYVVKADIEKSGASHDH